MGIRDTELGEHPGYQLTTSDWNLLLNYRFLSYILAQSIGIEGNYNHEVWFSHNVGVIQNRVNRIPRNIRSD